MEYYRATPNSYNEHNFIEIPEGSFRVIISNVTKKKTKKGNACFQITYKVSGLHGKLWHDLWYIPTDMDNSEKRFFSFFNSFQIKDYDLNNYKKWIGKMGAVRVIHETPRKNDLSDYQYAARVIYCIYGAQQDRLPPWSEASSEINLDFFNDVPF